jgi:cytochrome c peroxidase
MQRIHYLFVLLACLPALASAQDDDLYEAKLVDLGRALFFDVSLSMGKTQGCATCHDPAQAFIDWRGSAAGRAASVGNDFASLGDRNAPTLSYAGLTPDFHRNSEGQYVGGQFWDGREPDLESQAGAPFLNTLEMQMPDKATVVARLQEHTLFPYAFKSLFGEDVFDDVDVAFRRMTEAIAALERTEFFSPFDSRYDRYLRGEYEPTEEEELGMTLFFSEQFTNCNQCHQLKPFAESAGETFTNYQYFNVGTPVNKALRRANGLGLDHIDYGLLENPQVDDPAQAGKFKTPTLRNVAMTAPYMHNGVFNDLETVVRFYNKFNLRGPARDINPDTGEPWGEAEIAETIDLEKLESAPALDERRIQALVAFMKMLTDKRYEHLVN